MGAVTAVAATVAAAAAIFAVALRYGLSTFQLAFWQKKKQTTITH